MELRYAVLCDFANVTNEGKLNILGVFDRLFATSFPASHRQLYLINSIETEPEDEGETREIHVQLINADGRVITELRGSMNFGIGKQVVNQIHLFQDVQFPAPGPYQFNILFDGRTVKTLTMELQPLPPQPTVGSA